MPYPYFGNLGYPQLQNTQPGTSGYSGISEVSSIDEVKAASVLYGVSIFMDRNGGHFYAKNSQGLIKAFKYEEIPIPSNDPQNFVSRAEFDQLKEMYNDLASRQYAAAAAAQSVAQSDAANAGSAAVPGNTGASQGTTDPGNSQLWNDTGSGQ